MGKVTNGSALVNSRVETLVSELFRCVFRMIIQQDSLRELNIQTNSACVQAIKWLNEFACDIFRPLSAMANAVNSHMSNSTSTSKWRINVHLLSACETLCRDVTQKSSLDVASSYALGMKALVVSLIQASHVLIIICGIYIYVCMWYIYCPFQHRFIYLFYYFIILLIVIRI